VICLTEVTLSFLPQRHACSFCALALSGYRVQGGKLIANAKSAVPPTPKGSAKDTIRIDDMWHQYEKKILEGHKGQRAP
jgi:hypothetical protein